MGKINKFLKNNKGSAEMLSMAVLIVYVVLVVVPPIKTTSDTIFNALKCMDDKMKSQMTGGVKN